MLQLKNVPNSEKHRTGGTSLSFQEQHNDAELVDGGGLYCCYTPVVAYTAAARFASNEFVLPPLIEICHKIRARRAHTHKCSYKAG